MKKPLLALKPFLDISLWGQSPLSCITLLVAILSFLLPQTVEAEPPLSPPAINLTTSPERLSIQPFAEILRDSTAKMTLSDVAAAENHERWSPFPDGRPSFGWTKDAYWIRLRVKQDAPVTSQRFVRFSWTRISRIDAFQITSDGTITQSQAGLAIPVAEWPLRSNQLTFPIHPGASDITVLYFRIVNDTVMAIGAEIIGRETLHASKIEETARLSGFLVSMIIALVFGLMFFFTFRDRSYLWYLGMVVVSTLIPLSLQNFDTLFLYPSLPAMALASKSFWGILSLIISASFMTSFFGIKRRSRDWRNIAAWVVQGIEAPQLITAWIPHQPWIDQVCAFTGTASFILLLLICILSLVRSTPYAKLFLVGFCLYFLLFSIYVPVASGMAPEIPGYEWYPYVGVFSQLFFICFSVIQRIALLNKGLADNNTLLQNFNNRLKGEMALREKVQLELDVERRRGNERDRLRQMGEMARNIAHEINTPLSIVSFKVQNLEYVIRQRNGQDPAIAQATESVVRAVERASSILRTMRMMMKNSDNEPLGLVSLANISKELTMLCGEKTAQAKTEWRLKLPSRGISILARETEVFQILLNLVNNALEALQTTSREDRWVELSVHELENRVEIWVTDNGPGIPMHVRATLFDKDIPVKPGATGMGLGLHLAHSMARENGGTLFLDSPENPTRFVCSFVRANTD